MKSKESVSLSELISNTFKNKPVLILIIFAIISFTIGYSVGKPNKEQLAKLSTHDKVKEQLVEMNDELESKDLTIKQQDIRNNEIASDLKIAESKLKELELKEEEIVEEKPQEPTTLFSGTWTAGEDIEPGDYIITSKGKGHILIKDLEDRLVINETLGDEEQERTVTKIKVDLQEGYTIKISRIKEVYFTPN